jgi:ribonuclease P protein component
MRRSRDFTAAIRDGGRTGRRLIVAHLLLRQESGEAPRVGLVVSRVVGPAVVRNRVKRRLRHAARGYLHTLPGGSLLVLRANPPAATASQADLAAELGTVIRVLLGRQGGAV